MVKKFFKAGLSIALVFSIAVIPNYAAHVKAETVLPQSQSTAEVSAPISQSDKTSPYEGTKKLAESKAATLTTLYGVTSVQYALIDDGSILLSGQSGVYSKDSETPLTDTKMYGIGSISKMFTTVAVMQLAEEGKINLDTPVVKYIPEFTMADSRYKDITVRMLLNHSSGMMGSTFGSSMLFNDTDTTSYKELLNTLKTSRLKADPGEFSVYCNDGFTLAELLVEKISGVSFTDYIKENISGPLNLYNTKTPQDDFQKERLVKAYIPGSDLTLPVETLNMIGAGGIYSSALNLCRFATIFMDNSNSSVLDSASSKAMENKEYLNGIWPEDKASILSYGLGWDTINTYPFEKYGIKALSKGGDTLFYHGTLTVLPEENMAVAVLSSGGSSVYNEVLAQEILLSALKAKGVISEIHPDKTFTKPVKAIMPENQKQYAGVYGNTSGTSKITISDDGILTITSTALPEAGTQQFTYTGDGKFYTADGSIYLSFEQARNGITYLYVSGYSNLPGLGQTVGDLYQAQKLTANPISEDIKSAWEKRAGKNYFMLNEKYSSEYYTLGTLYSKLPQYSDLEGYVLNAAIVDSNTARMNIQIPGTYGRDLRDLTFYKEGNTEYFNVGGNILISEDDIPSLFNSAFTVDISGNGYAHWFKIGKEAANKTIQVTLPKNSSFTVYDGKDAYVMDSYITKKDTVTLPQNGYIVFAGDVNAHFAVKYIKK
ncbi:MAG: serine hydrolase domain-containing protein [Anaerocolumna sp.]